MLYAFISWQVLGFFALLCLSSALIKRLSDPLFCIQQHELSLYVPDWKITSVLYSKMPSTSSLSADDFIILDQRSFLPWKKDTVGTDLELEDSQDKTDELSCGGTCSLCEVICFNNC